MNMRKVVLGGLAGGFVVAGLLAPSALGQVGPDATQPAQPPREVEPAGPSPRLVLEEDLVDFGRMLDTRAIMREVGFRNDGDADLEILNINSTCGCTVGELQQKIYKPGEGGTLKVTFDPKNRQGQNHTTVTIVTNDQNRPVAGLEVKAFVVPQVLVEPPMVALGDMRRGELAGRLVSVTGLSSDFDIIATDVEGVEGVVVKVLGAEQIEVEGVPGRRVDLEVYVDGSHKPGQVRGSIVLTTNMDSHPTTNVGFFARVLGDVQASEPTIRLGTLGIDETVERVVRLNTRSGREFKILDVSQESNLEAPPGWDIQPVEGEPGAYDLTVRLRSLSRPGGLRGSLILTTDVPDEEKLQLVFFGAVQPAAAAAQAPANPVPPGHSVDDPGGG